MKRIIAFAGLMLTACPGTSCVARGSRVLTPDGWRPIEDLEVGDAIFAIREDDNECIETRVVAIRSATREVGLVAVGDVRLRMTSDHPVYCPIERDYFPAGDWFLGKRDQLAIWRGERLRTERVTAVSTYVAVEEVFDITVNHECHNFVAEGVLVHNKSIVPNCEYQGKSVSNGLACDCPSGETGSILCDSDGGASCECPGPDAGVTDMGPSDSSSNNIAVCGPDDLFAYVEGNCECPSVGCPWELDAGSDATTPDGGTDGGDTTDMSIPPRERGTCSESNPCAQADWDCIPIAATGPEAYHTCQPSTAAAPGCDTIEPPDNCCQHADCTMDPSGTCVIGPIFYCGGVQPVIANVCLYDECANDTDCQPDQFCLPPRVLAEPVARCAFAECRLDSDCASRAGGQCEAFFDPCNGRFSGFYCTYDDSACRTNEDCPGPNDAPNATFCSPGPDGATQCIEFQPPP